MNDITDEAIVIQCDYVDRPAGHDASKEKKAEKLEFVPEFTDININNVVCYGAATAIKAKGIEGLNCIHGISISNSTFSYIQEGVDIDAATSEVKLENVSTEKIICQI